MRHEDDRPGERFEGGLELLDRGKVEMGDARPGTTATVGSTTTDDRHGRNRGRGGGDDDD